jgi:hypothetical protein
MACELRMGVNDVPFEDSSGSIPEQFIFVFELNIASKGQYNFSRLVVILITHSRSHAGTLISTAYGAVVHFMFVFVLGCMFVLG